MSSEEIGRNFNIFKKKLLTENTDYQYQINNLNNKIKFNNTVLDFMAMIEPKIKSKIEFYDKRIKEQENYIIEVEQRAADYTRQKELIDSATVILNNLINERTELIRKLYF